MEDTVGGCGGCGRGEGFLSGLGRGPGASPAGVAKGIVGAV